MTIITQQDINTPSTHTAGSLDGFFILAHSIGKEKHYQDIRALWKTLESLQLRQTLCADRQRRRGFHRLRSKRTSKLSIARLQLIFLGFCTFLQDNILFLNRQVTCHVRHPGLLQLLVTTAFISCNCTFGVPASSHVPFNIDTASFQIAHFPYNGSPKTLRKSRGLRSP